MSHYDSGALADFHLVTASHTLCAVGTFPYTNVLAAAFLLFIFEEVALRSLVCLRLISLKFRTLTLNVLGSLMNEAGMILNFIVHPSYLGS